MSNLKIIVTKTLLCSYILAILAQPLLSLAGRPGTTASSSATSQFSSNYDFVPTIFTLSSPASSLSVSEDGAIPVAIKAINPGYTTDAGKNAGEFIELVNLADEPVPLDDLAVIYTAKPTASNVYGKSTILYRFPTGSIFTGSTILLRFASAPEATDGNQDLTYDTSLAMNGSLSLVQLPSDFDPSSIPDTSPLSDYGESFNSVCWLGGEDCLPYFSTTVKSRSYTTILRDEDTGEYAHVTDYLPAYDPKNPGLYLPPSPASDFSTDNTVASKPTGSSASSKSQEEAALFDPSKDSMCQGLIFSEILSYYDAEPSEQFIEFYNSTSDALSIGSCKLKYKNKYYNLAPLDTVLQSSEYYVLRPDFSLTKNPTTENTLELYDVNGTVVSTLSYPHGQKKSAAYALIGYNEDGTENWKITYAVTPGAANYYQEFKSCPAGKVINEATGNCVKAAAVSNTLADCPAGKYRNPATGRCKNISSDDGTSECKEGYERNPETNRCRKIKSNNGADYPVVPVTGITEKSTFIALWAIIAIAVIGILYIAFQFRREIIYFFRKFITKLKR